MLATTGHAVHIDTDKSHSGPKKKMATQLYLLQDYQKFISSLEKKKMMHFEKC
jgi:hypothetical protein